MTVKARGPFMSYSSGVMTSEDCPYSANELDHAVSAIGWGGEGWYCEPYGCSCGLPFPPFLEIRLAAPFTSAPTAPWTPIWVEVLQIRTEA